MCVRLSAIAHMLYVFTRKINTMQRARAIDNDDKFRLGLARADATGRPLSPCPPYAYATFNRRERRRLLFSSNDSIPDDTE